MDNTDRAAAGLTSCNSAGRRGVAGTLRAWLIQRTRKLHQSESFEVITKSCRRPVVLHDQSAGAPNS